MVSKNSIRHFWTTIQELLVHKSSIVVMWSGGNSVVEFFKYPELLNGIEFERINFFLGDERLVDICDKNSNTGNLISCLNNVNKASQVLKYSQGFVSEVENLIHLNGGIVDISLLGMGEDGHTLGVFEEFESDSLIFQNSNENYTRFTFSISWVNHVSNITCLICNTDQKRLSLQQGKGPVSNLKITHVYD